MPVKNINNNIMKVQSKQSLYKTPTQKHPNPPTPTLQSLHRSLFITKKHPYPHTAHNNSTNTFTSNIKKQSTTPISRAQPAHFQDHDPYLYSRIYQNINEYEQFQSQSMQQKTMTVMNQLNVSYFYSLCVGFQDNVRNVMEILIGKILELEVKVAEVLGKFYKVEMSLHRKAKYIKTLVDENCVLIQLNRDVQVRMEQLRQKYEVSCLSMKSQWMGNVVDQIKNQVSKYEIDSNICQGCQNDIKQQLTKQLKKLHKTITTSLPIQSPQPHQKSQASEQPSNLLHKILQATIKSLKQILELCTQKSMEQTEKILKTKILENIDLKFEVIQKQFINRCREQRESRGGYEIRDKNGKDGKDWQGQ